MLKFKLSKTSLLAIDGLAILGQLSRLVRGGQLLPAWLDAPNLTSILGDRAVARKFARRGNVEDRLACPLVRVLQGVKMLSDKLKYQRATRLTL